MVEEVGGIRYHHFHRNHMWVGKCPVDSGRLCMGTKAAKRAVSHGKKTAFADGGSRVVDFQQRWPGAGPANVLLFFRPQIGGPKLFPPVVLLLAS